MSTPENDLRECEWRRAARSLSNGACVEVATTATAVVIRDSKASDGVVLQCSFDSWHFFVADAKTGRFDRPSK